jgi:leader peptidase (prepilin peptidase)/N-methyltransferase
MWAVPMFVATTWWSWRSMSSRTTGSSFRLVAWGVGGSLVVGVPLVVATLRTTDQSWLSPLWAVWGLVIGAIGVLMAIDVDVQLLPRELSLPVFVVSLVALSIIEGPAEMGRWGPLLGATLMTTVTLFLRLVSRGSLGMGDVLVSPLLGAVLGWFDPWVALSAWLVAAIVGASVAVVALVRGAPRQRLVAYGPFLFVGTAVALLGTAL